MNTAAPSVAAELEPAYAACRAVARREAKNFYYAFIALPPARRNAICAVYAFMRQADDLADDERRPRDERRRNLEAWLAGWREAVRGGETDDPVFVAVRHAMDRFAIPPDLLEKLVAGVALDVKEGAAGAPDTYATFAELYEYCYLVASVVGLICIRIFGYRDPAAEKLAEETGIALQLTNILRDVAEDAGRGRVYLPVDLLRSHGLTVEGLLRRPAGAPPTPSESSVFSDLAGRAEGYYRSAAQLLPLIAPESRPALWVLVTIYHRLLRRIRATDYDVFSRRVSVPKVQKLGILAVGQARVLAARALSRP
jgi:phytoene synthase